MMLNYPDALLAALDDIAEELLLTVLAHWAKSEAPFKEHGRARESSF
jgi:hypothetical protein